MDNGSIYRSYLLRLRRYTQPRSDAVAWRISLVEPGQQQEHVFETIDALCIHLVTQMAADPKNSNKEDASD